MKDKVTPFGKIIRDARDARRPKKMNQEDLAEELGVSQSLVSMWETGRVQPSPADVGRLAKLLGLDPMEMLDALPARTKRESTKKRAEIAA